MAGSSSTETLLIITGDSDVVESSTQGASRAIVRAGPYMNDDEGIPPTFLIARVVLLNLHQPNIFIGARSLGLAVLPPVNLIKTYLSSKQSNNSDEVAICELT
jgi:hypothetical protein